MKKTEVLLDALFLLIYQIISCMVVYFAAWMLLKIIDKFVLLNYFTVFVLYGILIFVGVGILLALYAYYGTYKTAVLHVGETLLSNGIAIVMHLLIAAVFSYLPLLSGAPRYLSALLANGANLTSSEQLANIPGFLPPLLFLVIMLLYHAVMLLLRRLALHKRLMDRYELTGSVE